MANSFTVPKIISSNKISGVEQYKPTVEKLIKSLGYRQIEFFGLNNVDIVDASIKPTTPIIFTFKNSKLNQIKKLNRQNFVRLITNKVGKLTPTQEKVKKRLQTVPIYTVVDEENNLVINVPHSFLELKKENRNNWEVPIYFSFFDKKHAEFYCDDLNEEFNFLNKSFKVRTLNLGSYYELVYTQGPKSLFYLFPDLDGIRFGERLSKNTRQGLGIPSFSYRHLNIKNNEGEVWDGKFQDLDSDQRVTPVFLSYKDAVKYWKKFRKLESKFSLPSRPPIEYVQLDKQIFKLSESDFLSKDFVFFPSSEQFLKT